MCVGVCVCIERETRHHQSEPSSLRQGKVSDASTVILTYEVVSREELLEELGFLLLHRLDDEFIIGREVEERAASPRIGQLSQRLVT